MIFHDSTCTPLVRQACDEVCGMIARLEREAQGRFCRINLDSVALWSAQSVAPTLSAAQHQELANQVLDKISWLLTTECEGEA